MRVTTRIAAPANLTGTLAVCILEGSQLARRSLYPFESSCTVYRPAGLDPRTGPETGLHTTLELRKRPGLPVGGAPSGANDPEPETTLPWTRP